MPQIDIPVQNAAISYKSQASERHRPHRAGHSARCERGRDDSRPAALGRREDRGPGDRPRRPGGRVPRDHAGRARGGGKDCRMSRNPVIRLEGARTLFYKEVLRFWKVSFQTVAAPVLTAVLYLLIFGHVLEGRVKVYDAVGYTSFLIPGLVMMS